MNVFGIEKYKFSENSICRIRKIHWKRSSEIMVGILLNYAVVYSEEFKFNNKLIGEMSFEV